MVIIFSHTHTIMVIQLDVIYTMKNILIIEVKI